MLRNCARVGGVFAKGALCRNGLSLAGGHDRRGVFTLGFAPDDAAGFAEHALHHVDGHFLQGGDAANAEVAQCLVGLFADHGDFADAQRRQKWALCAVLYADGIVGLGFAGGDFGDGLVLGKTKGNGEPRFAHDLLPKLAGVLPAAKEAVHSSEVGVKLIDGGFFAYGNGLADDVGDGVRILGVGGGVAANDQASGQSSRAMRMGMPE